MCWDSELWLLFRYNFHLFLTFPLDINDIPTPWISSALTSNKTSLDTGKIKCAIKAWQYVWADYINNPNSDRGVASRLVNKRDKINEYNVGKFVLVLFDRDDFLSLQFELIQTYQIIFVFINFLAEEKKERECRCWIFKGTNFQTLNGWYVLCNATARKKGKSKHKKKLFVLKLGKLLRI